MHYHHEAEWRKASPHPMCTTHPPQDKTQDDMYQYLASRNLSYNLAVMNGWYQSSEAGDTYPRVVIPAMTHVPGHAYWQAREIYDSGYLRYTSPKGPRHEALIGVIPEDDHKGVVIVEGPMDALAAAGAGYVGIALMGMLPSAGTVDHLVKIMPAGKILVLLDRDSEASGPRLSWKLAAKGIKTRVAFLPGPEKDLCQCLPAKRKKFLESVFKNLSLSKSSVKETKSGKPVKSVRSSKVGAGKRSSSH